MGLDKSQEEVIRDALLRGEKLTQDISTKHYGIKRLAAIINLIKFPKRNKEALDVKSKRIDAPTRYGDGKTKVAQYWVEVKRGQLSLL